MSKLCLKMTLSLKLVSFMFKKKFKHEHLKTQQMFKSCLQLFLNTIQTNMFK